jgi:alpha-glucosidase
VTIVDPGVKYQPPQPGAKDEARNPELAPQDRSYFVFNQGLEKNYFMKRKDGSLYIGRVWPGDSVFVDYTLADARRWWGEMHRTYTDHGVAGIWTDMNEPADFIDQTGKKQMDVVSYDEGEYSTHAKNRNVFALLMARATYEGLERLLPDQRPYVITRAAYAGIQRYSTMWTGDNNSTWDALALSLPMFQTLGLSGQPFVGADVGGFIGRSNGEMLARWYQVGFLTPFLRNHKAVDYYDHEPWRFGKFYTDIIRKYLKLRYRMMPFLYTTLEEAHRTGVPVFRPLLLNYQKDTNTLNLDDQFMIGSDLLVAPVLKPDLTGRMVYLPEGTWLDYWTGKAHTGPTMVRVEAPLDTAPMFIRNGAIIPTGPEMSYIGEKRFDPVTFEVYLDTGGQGSYTLYEDDGISPDYKKGVVRRTQVSASKNGGGYKLNLEAPSGSYNPGERSFVFLFKWAKGAGRVTVDGKALAASTAGEKRNGWHKTGDGVAVRLADDGKAHQIEVR